MNDRQFLVIIAIPATAMICKDMFLHSYSFQFLMHTYERMCIEWMTHTLKGYLLNRHLLKGYVLKRYELMTFIDMHGMTFRYANNLLKNSAPKRLSEKSDRLCCDGALGGGKKQQNKIQLWSSQCNYPTPRGFWSTIDEVNNTYKSKQISL